MRKGPPIAPAAVIALVLVVVFIMVAVGISVFAGMKAGEQERHDADALSRAQDREEARVAQLRSDPRANELPDDWDVDVAFSEVSSSALSPLVDIAYDVAWDGGGAGKFTMLNWIETVRGERSEDVQEPFQGKGIATGEAINAFREYLVASSELSALKRAALTG